MSPSKVYFKKSKNSTSDTERLVFELKSLVSLKSAEVLLILCLLYVKVVARYKSYNLITCIGSKLDK
jgi:hypothetical protein